MRVVVIWGASLWAAACAEPVCVPGQGEECTVPSPCSALPTATCDDPTSRVKIVQPGDPVRPMGPAATAAAGDMLLSNSRVTAVISAIQHPSGLSPTGGSLIDLERTGAADDGLAQTDTVIGPLADDAVAYTEAVLLDEAGGIFAVQVSGSVVGRPEVHVATRYEIRPCEDGLRIRTEVANSGSAIVPVSPADGWSLGGRGLSAVAPGGSVDPRGTWPPENSGPFPWVAFGLRGDSASYATASCDGTPVWAGLHEFVTSVGPGTRFLTPGETLVFERFVAVSPGPSPAAAVVALSAPDEITSLVGRVTLPASDPGVLGAPARAMVDAWDEEDLSAPWGIAVPDAEGAFALEVPPDRDWTIVFEAFGTSVAERHVASGPARVDLGAVEIPAAAALQLEVESEGWALVQILPAGATAAAPCAPLLGLPSGGSPACNRVLVSGEETVAVPAGRWDVVATAGPFSTLDRVTVEVDPGEVAVVALAVSPIAGLRPDGLMSADAHLHGAGSFDSALPDRDRIASLLAADLDIVVATDHDRVTDWSDALTDLDADLLVVAGVEATPELPFALIEGASPGVIGHWIAWPLTRSPWAAWGGAPPEEATSPAEWFDRLEAYGWSSEIGVVQLPHPWASTRLGRDLGWASALEVDFSLPLDGSLAGMQAQFLASPAQTAHSNADYAVQEVLSGPDTASFAQLRAMWHELLNLGILRAASANSDSHSLLDMGPGSPRNLVSTDPTAAGTWSTLAFAQALSAGQSVGTNGPIVTVTTTDIDGRVVEPGLTPFVAENVAVLSIRVAAAPWIPVDEVRIVVNGLVVARYDDLPAPDPTGRANEGFVRFEIDIPLRDVLGPEDGWIVIEAGATLRSSPDTDGNGVPDLPTPAAQPFSETDPRWLWSVLAAGAEPIGFTNPLLVDHDGLGFVGPDE